MITVPLAELMEISANHEPEPPTIPDAVQTQPQPSISPSAVSLREDHTPTLVGEDPALSSCTSQAGCDEAEHMTQGNTGVQVQSSYIYIPVLCM